MQDLFILTKLSKYFFMKRMLEIILFVAEIRVVTLPLKDRNLCLKTSERKPSRFFFSKIK